MGKYKVLLMGLYFILPLNAFGGEYKFCLLLNRVADGGALRTYSDEQIQNGLCMVTKEMAYAIAQDNEGKEAICTEAAIKTMEEFKRRFPSKNPKTVIGRC